MRRECKCHGLSGACTMNTCWQKLPPFREVANRLKDSLDQALRIDMYVAPQSSSLSTNWHKSLTPSLASTSRKSNKKRSSSIQPQSSLDRPALNGFGRSLTAASQSSDIQALALTSPTSPINIRLPNGGGGSGSSRLQAYQQETPTTVSVAQNIANSIAQGVSNSNGNNIDGGQVEASLDALSSREIAHNSILNPSTPASPLMNSTTLIKRRPIARSIGLTASQKRLNGLDLYYAEESPDFCVPSERYNIKGTKGRICSENPKVSNSCERLCCGRGYKTEKGEESYKCECKFQFCCKLECKVCTRRRIIHKCL